MADGTSSDGTPKKMKKKGYSLLAMGINTAISGIIGFFSAVGLGAATNSIRTPEEREAANRAAELAAKTPATKQG